MVGDGGIAAFGTDVRCFVLDCESEGDEDDDSSGT